VEAPALIVPEVAAKLVICASFKGMTVTITASVTGLPAAPLQERVYAVVAAGMIAEVVPAATGVALIGAEPAESVIVQLVALLEVQLSVMLPPTVIEVGLALSVAWTWPGAAG
jgi:hypothetical protein